MKHSLAREGTSSRAKNVIQHEHGRRACLKLRPSRPVNIAKVLSDVEARSILGLDGGLG